MYFTNSKSVVTLGMWINLMILQSFFCLSFYHGFSLPLNYCFSISICFMTYEAYDQMSRMGVKNLGDHTHSFVLTSNVDLWCPSQAVRGQEIFTSCRLSSTHQDQNVWSIGTERKLYMYICIWSQFWPESTSNRADLSASGPIFTQGSSTN